MLDYEFIVQMYALEAMCIGNPLFRNNLQSPLIPPVIRVLS
jgi:hypothetical protein